MLRWTRAEREQEKERQRVEEEKVSLSVTLENKERLGSTRGLPKAPVSSFPRDPPTSEMRCWGS